MVGDQLGRGINWKLGASIISPPLSKAITKKSLMFNYKGGAKGAWDKMSVKCLVEGGKVKGVK